MSPIRFLASTTALALLLLVPPSAHGTLHLTEFMADNGGSHFDADGDSSDWIEIFNFGPGDANLDGYFLTDNEGALTKWRFPAEQLAEGAFLVVFASEKDRRVAGAELHTNFKIDQDGEYLALIAPNGTTVITEYGAGAALLPSQFKDVSYGLKQTGNRTPSVLIQSDAAGSSLVPAPADAALGTSWTEVPFDDTTWRAVQTGVGYDENNTYVSEFGSNGNLDASLNGVNTSFYLRVPFQLSDVSSIAELSLRMKYDDGFVCFLNGTHVQDENAPALETLAYNSESTANHADGEATTFASFDLTSFAHLLQNGSNVLAIQGLNDGLGSSDMLITPELHAVRITDPSIGDSGYLGTPTPGSFNGEAFDGFVADTKFSVDRGFFDTPFQLEITTTTENSEIRYTLDGTPPGESQGLVYTGPIAITRTTIVRALAHRTGYEPTNIDTHSYLFPTDVITQQDMRSSITQSALYGPQMISSLKEVPSISIVTQNTGFLNEGAGNIREEYQSSVEMIFPDGTPGFQEDGGLSNYGGRFTNFRKKSFRVAFRSRFGTKKLNYPIFDGFHYKSHPPTDSFDVINLRSGSHDMSSRGAYMSNRFTDDSMLDMGNIGPHGRFVHVYLNGNYWGQYHLRERWSAEMASSYFYGPEADYEAINANDNFQNDEEVYDGSGQFWSETKSLVSGVEPFNNSSAHIDAANIIDFMILWVSGNSESEFRAFGSDPQGVPLKFMIKDADGFLRMPSASKAGHNGPLSMMSRFQSGLGGADFDLLVADRIHKHFFNDGALTPAQNIERLQKRVNEARLGFISEAARWGDIFRDPPSWESYQTNLVNNHFPGLTNTMISRFKSEGMYPDVIAPVFSKYGGSVSPDTPITMSTDADTIYYTLDGSDPRLPGGVPNPTALTAVFGGAGTSPVTFLTTGSSWNYLDDGSNQLTAWQAPEFNDGSWMDGPSPLGYGGDGEVTPLSYGPNAKSKFATTYFRTQVDVPDPSLFINFLLRLRYDDAAAVYLNGTETIRTPNLPTGAPFSQYANSDNGNEGSWFDYTIPTTSFVAGINTLAVEVHQGDGQSSDIRLDMFLRGETTQGGGNNVSDAIFFSEPTMLRSRSFNTGTGEWSALNEAFFTIDTVSADSSNLVISELHYHPSNPNTPAELAVGNDRDDFEFVEFLNIGPSTLDLTSVRFDVAINFAFPTGTVLPAGERVLLLRKRAAFEARYGPLPNIQSFEYTGRFSNDGERVLLTGAGVGPILDFVYNDQLPWPTNSDGLGPSMVLLNPFAQPDHGEATNWSASRFPGGSPGVAEPTGFTYAAWAASHALVGGPDDDDDGDTVSNYLEYLYGSRPDLANEAPGLNAVIQSIEVGGVVDRYLTVTFPENLEAQGSLTLEISGDLLTWNSDPARTELVSKIDNDDGTATVSLRLADPVSPAQKVIFVRLRGN
jgi:hypothetical protein